MPRSIDTSFSSHNHLLALARSAVRQPHWLAVLLLGVGFFLVGQLAGGLLLFPVLLQTPLASDAIAASPLLSGVQNAITIIGLFLPIGLLLWGWLKTYEKRPLWTLGLERDRAISTYLRGWLLGAVLFGGTVLPLALLGLVTLQPGQATGAGGLLGLLLMLAGFVVQGAIEEIICRGWMLPVLGSRYRWQIGVTLSSLFFALVHGLNANISVLALTNIFLIGVFLALYSLRRGSLWGACGFHTAWNWTQGNILGFTVSGASLPMPTLFSARETGPDLLTGGAFGPEGGLAVTLVVALAIASLARMTR